MGGQADKPSFFVACIKDARGEPLGTGILLSRQWVLTCAHVVESALDERAGTLAEAPELPVTVSLPFTETGHEAEARVVQGLWLPVNQDAADTATDDLAVLELDSPAPDDAHPAVFEQAM